MSGGLEPITLYDSAQVQKHKTLETWADVVKRGTKHENKSNPLVIDKCPKIAAIPTRVAETKQNHDSKPVYTPHDITTNANLLVKDKPLPSRSAVPLNVTPKEARTMTKRQRHVWKPFTNKHLNKTVAERNHNSTMVYTPRDTPTTANLVVKDNPLPSRSPVPLNVTPEEARLMTEKQRYFWRVAFTDDELKGNSRKKCATDKHPNKSATESKWNHNSKSVHSPRDKSLYTSTRRNTTTNANIRDIDMSLLDRASACGEIIKKLNDIERRQKRDKRDLKYHTK